MSVGSGPKISTNGLILHLDARSQKNYSSFTTNLISNGNFIGGTGSSNEGGSNPTNTVVGLKNPGDSPYVLRQNGDNTEYQLNLTTQMTANTTYVMSGWYSKSMDYNGGDVMFHARAHSASGAHSATGTGLGTILYTTNVDGREWKYVYHTITTPSDYSNDFNWYVGYGQPVHAGYRYYANLKVELGNFPSLCDLSNTNNHHRVVGSTTFSNGQLTFDGSTSGIVRSSALTNVSNSCTVVVWYSTTDTQELWVRGNQNNSVYLSASSSNNYYHSGVGSPTNYVDLTTVVRPDSPINYRNGAYHMWEAKGVDFSGWNYYEWFLYPSNWQMIGNASTILVYNRILTASESAKNLYAFRSRFN